MQYVFFSLCLFRIDIFLFTYKGNQNLLETNKLKPTNRRLYHCLIHLQLTIGSAYSLFQQPVIKHDGTSHGNV